MKPAMTATSVLADRLAEGPVSVADLMALSIGDPQHGSYAQRDPFGSAGDFITAPEISQIFGELIGLALAQAWLDQGAPTPVYLVEFGPGRGTLMADIWRAISVVPTLQAAAQVHLVETSPRLREMQAARLADLQPRWHDDVRTLPDSGALLIVGNEFLDALPVHQLVAPNEDGAGWTERCLALNTDGSLAWSQEPAAEALLNLVAPELRQAPATHGLGGVVVEVAPFRLEVVRRMAQRVAAQGGIALWVDYGGSPELAAPATLQAVHRHRCVDVLEALSLPSPADLSAAVDFAALKAACEPFSAIFGPQAQATVLRRLGIEMRALDLARRVEGQPNRCVGVMAGVRRLLDPQAMGEAFKMMAAVPKGAPPPAGFLDPRGAG